MQRVAGPQTTIVYAKGANIVDNPAQAARLNVHGQTVFIDERPPQAMIAEAVALACQADVVVAVVGEAKEASGESSSCTDISLPENQKKLLRALQATGKPLVVVVMSGRPLVLQEEYTLADAILLPWFAGTEAGNGIADILFGEVNPAGKLTTTFPYHVGQIPVYYAQEPGGRPFPGHFQKFTSGYLDMPDHVLHHDGLFPFGFGLSYTTFAYSPLRVNRTVLTPDGVLEASVTVQNTGDRSGDEIVQLYITDPVASISRPVKQLRGFQTVSLAPGAAREVTFRLTPEALKFYQARSLTDYDYDWEAGEFVISIGPNARDTQHISIVWERSLALALV
jgi:beta-glucosidase